MGAIRLATSASTDEEYGGTTIKGYEIMDIDIDLPSSVSISSQNADFALRNLDIKNSAIVDKNTNKTLQTLLTGCNILSAQFEWATSSVCAYSSCFLNSELLTIKLVNPTASSVTISAVRFLLFVERIS